MHVLACILLRRAVLQLAQERAGVGRVDDGQALHALGLLVGQVPGHGAAPVVGHQRGQWGIRAFEGNQRGKVAHQVLGAVGLDLGGGAGAPKATQKGGHAAVATVFGAGEVGQEFVPDEGALGKTVQKQQHGAARCAAGMAVQVDAVRQRMDDGFDHGAMLSGASSAHGMGAQLGFDGESVSASAWASAAFTGTSPAWAPVG